MTHLIDRLAVLSANTKIDRSAFLYLSPKPPIDDFAQCGSCALFNNEIGRCAIHGPELKITAEDSCGLYLQGSPHKQPYYKILVSPQSSGFVRDKVRCENCSWPKNGHCGLYKLLNKQLPDVFDLDEKIEAKGCCNAWQSA